MARQLPCEWHSRYGVEPLLLETLVDHSRYRGTCYRAANWIELGVTTRRGRMDREYRRHGASSKTVLVLPLVKDPRRVLVEAVLRHVETLRLSRRRCLACVPVTACHPANPPENRRHGGFVQAAADAVAHEKQPRVSEATLHRVEARVKRGLGARRLL